MEMPTPARKLYNGCCAPIPDVFSAPSLARVATVDAQALRAASAMDYGFDVAVGNVQKAYNASAPLVRFRKETIKHFGKDGFCVGRGSFGNVWRVFLTTENGAEGHQYALKQFKLLPVSSGSGQYADEIQKERDFLIYLRHERVSKIVGAYYDGDPMIVMELYAGSLRLLGDSFSEREKGRAMVQILQGLEFIHGRNICHNDLRPDNVLVKTNGSVVISDFGVAVYLDKDVHESHRRLSCNYYSDEQANYSHMYSKSSDMFAFACLAFEIFTKSGLMQYKRREDVSTAEYVKVFKVGRVSNVDKETLESVFSVRDNDRVTLQNRIARLFRWPELLMPLVLDRDQRLTATEVLALPIITQIMSHYDFNPANMDQICDNTYAIWGKCQSFSNINRPRDPDVEKAVFGPAFYYDEQISSDYTPYFMVRPDAKTLANYINDQGLTAVWLEEIRKGNPIALAAFEFTCRPGPNANPIPTRLLAPRHLEGQRAIQNVHRIELPGPSPKLATVPATAGKTANDLAKPGKTASIDLGNQCMTSLASARLRLASESQPNKDENSGKEKQVSASQTAKTDQALMPPPPPLPKAKTSSSGVKRKMPSERDQIQEMTTEVTYTNTSQPVGPPPKRALELTAPPGIYSGRFPTPNPKAAEPAVSRGSSKPSVPAPKKNQQSAAEKIGLKSKKSNANHQPKAGKPKPDSEKQRRPNSNTKEKQTKVTTTQQCGSQTPGQSNPAEGRTESVSGASAGENQSAVMVFVCSLCNVFNTSKPERLAKHTKKCVKKITAKHDK